MRLRIQDLGEPALEFGNGETGKDPKRILPKAGPFGAAAYDGIKQVRLGLVTPASEATAIRRWIDKMHTLLLEQESNAERFREFPGAAGALRCTFDLRPELVRTFNLVQYEQAISANPIARFDLLLNLYANAVESLCGDHHPDCILVCFPEQVASLRVANPRLTAKEQYLLEQLQRAEEDAQLSLFEPTPEDKKAASELLAQASELLFRTFHRALKARCMTRLKNPVPLQVVRRQTYVPAEAKQSNATRAWNLGVALYYKAGNIPWRPKDLAPGTCFVGISFHYLKRRSGDLLYASIAQAFSNEHEPFALKGASVPRDQTRERQPYLTEGQASQLVGALVDKYTFLTGSPPTRVVVHKTSRYQAEESRGFRDCLQARVPAHDLVWVAPTGFRLLRRGMKEPLRGTLCTLQDQEHYLFTTGYVPWWREYPGPHIPAPLQIATETDSNIVERARELLLLTKMNWNSAEGISRHPISLTFARRVGMIMTELDEEEEPNPLYRFYM